MDLNKSKEAFVNEPIQKGGQDGPGCWSDLKTSQGRAIKKPRRLNYFLCSNFLVFFNFVFIISLIFAIFDCQ